MPSPETLARLTAKAINPDGAFGGKSSSKDELTSAEIAFLLRGLTSEQMAFAQAKYMGDAAAQTALLLTIIQHAIDESRRGKWKVRPSQIMALADLAVTEAMTKQLTESHISRILDVTVNGYRHCWKDKYLMLMNFLYDIDAAIKRSINSNH